MLPNGFLTIMAQKTWQQEPEVVWLCFIHTQEAEREGEEGEGKGEGDRDQDVGSLGMCFLQESSIPEDSIAPPPQIAPQSTAERCLLPELPLRWTSLYFPQQYMGVAALHTFVQESIKMVIIDFSNYYSKLLFYNGLRRKYILSHSESKQWWVMI